MIEGSRIRTELLAAIGQWSYEGCNCFVHIGRGIITRPSYECAACGNTNLRFIHVLEHQEDHRQIWVGIECACVLIGDYELPHLAENETKRKERWRRRYGRPGRCWTTIENLVERGKL